MSNSRILRYALNCDWQRAKNVNTCGYTYRYACSYANKKRIGERSCTVCLAFPYTHDFDSAGGRRLAIGAVILVLNVRCFAIAFS